VKNFKINIPINIKELNKQQASDNESNPEGFKDPDKTSFRIISIIKFNKIKEKFKKELVKKVNY